MKLLIEMNHTEVIGKLHPMKIKEMINKETIKMTRRESAFHLKGTENLSIFNAIMETTETIRECKKSLEELNEMIAKLALNKN